MGGYDTTTRGSTPAIEQTETTTSTAAPPASTRYLNRGTIPPVASKSSSASASASDRAFGPPAPDDVQDQRLTVAKSKAAEVQRRAAKAMPGAASTTMHADASTEDQVAGVEHALHDQLGVGDESGFKKFLGKNQIGINTFVQALAGGTKDEHPGTADFYRLAMVGLKAKMPDAKFELVLAETKHGGGGPGLIPTEGPLIAATTAKGTQVFALHQEALGQGQDLAKVMTEAGLADEWYAALQSMHTHEYTEHDRGNAKSSLGSARDHSIGMNGGAIAAALLRMQPADQVHFLAAFDKAAGFGPGAQAMLGGLVVKSATPTQTVATAKADHLATGAPMPKDASVEVDLGGVTEPHRNWNFLNQNYKQVIAARMSQNVLRGTDPRTLRGTDLDNEIGMAMGETQTSLADSEEQLEKFNQRKWNNYSGNKRVEAITKKIREKGGDSPTVLVLPILFDAKTSDDIGFVQFPLFQVGGQLIDHTGRVYDSMADWRHSNTLPAGRISFPKNLAMHESKPGELEYTTEDTHAKHPSNVEKAEGALDRAALVGGIILGGAAIVGSGGTLAVAGGVIAGTYGAARAGQKIEDRADHEQSINPFSNADARSAWLDFGSNVLAVATVGTSALAGSLAEGANAVRTAGAVAEGAQATRAAMVARLIAGASRTADVATQLNTVNELRAHWSEMTPAERATISLQLGFWGVQQYAGHVHEERSRYSTEQAEETLERAIDPTAAKAETKKPAATETASAPPVTAPVHAPAETETRAVPAEHAASKPATEKTATEKTATENTATENRATENTAKKTGTETRTTTPVAEETHTTLPPHLAPEPAAPAHEEVSVESELASARKTLDEARKRFFAADMDKGFPQAEGEAVKAAENHVKEVEAKVATRDKQAKLTSSQSAATHALGAKQQIAAFKPTDHVTPTAEQLRTYTGLTDAQVASIRTTREFETFLADYSHYLGAKATLEHFHELAATLPKDPAVEALVRSTQTKLAATSKKAFDKLFVLDGSGARGIADAHLRAVTRDVEANHHRQELVAAGQITAEQTSARADTMLKENQRAGQRSTSAARKLVHIEKGKLHESPLGGYLYTPAEIQAGSLRNDFTNNVGVHADAEHEGAGTGASWLTQLESRGISIRVQELESSGGIRESAAPRADGKKAPKVYKAYYDPVDKQLVVRDVLIDEAPGRHAPADAIELHDPLETNASWEKFLGLVYTTLG